MSHAPSQHPHSLQTRFADIAHAGVYALAQPLTPTLDDLIHAAEACAYRVFRIDLTHAQNKDGLLKTIGHIMAFPAWSGYNWDALADHLGDLSWQPAAGYLVILEHSEQICRRTPDDFISTLQIFSAAADEWRERGIAFWCLTDAHANDIASFPAV